MVNSSLLMDSFYVLVYSRDLLSSSILAVCSMISLSLR